MNYTLEDLQKNFKDLTHILLVKLERDDKHYKSPPKSEFNKQNFTEIQFSDLPEERRNLIQFLQNTLKIVTSKYEEIENQIKKLADGSNEQQDLKALQKSFLYAYCGALDIVSKFGLKTFRNHSTLTVKINEFISEKFSIPDTARAYNRFKDLIFLHQSEIFFNVSAELRKKVTNYAIEFGKESNKKAINSYEEMDSEQEPNILRFTEIIKNAPANSHSDDITHTSDIIAKTTILILDKYKTEENIPIERRKHKKIMDELQSLLERLNSEDARLLNLPIRGILYSIALSCRSAFAWDQLTWNTLNDALNIESLSALQKFEYLQYAYRFLENQLLVISPTETCIRKKNLFSSIGNFEAKKLLNEVAMQLYSEFSNYICSSELSNTNTENKETDLQETEENILLPS